MTTKPDGQLAAFRLYPEKGKSGLYVLVRVFRSERTMRRYIATGPVPRRLGRYGRAMSSSWTAMRMQGGRMRVLPELGEIVVPVKRLGNEVISHECAHSALAWADRLGIDPMAQKKSNGHHFAASPDEERFCYGLGQMVKQFVSRCYDFGFFT